MEDEKTRKKWGSYERPMHIDPDSLDPFTVARMTDHNVRGVEDEKEEEEAPPKEVKENEKEAKKNKAA